MKFVNAENRMRNVICVLDHGSQTHDTVRDTVSVLHSGREMIGDGKFINGYACDVMTVAL